MAALSPQPIVPSAATRTSRRGPMAAAADPSKFAPAFRGAAIASSGDERRRWWAPLLRTIRRNEAAPEEQPEQPASEEAAAEATVRRARLTAEKARVLRREMRATEVWHDAMYHSAIASRLASAEQP